MAERKVMVSAKNFGETPFDGRFAHPAMIWCYAHQAAPKVVTLWKPPSFRIPQPMTVRQ